MKNKFFRIFLIFTFVVAHFFTQQLHQLTHLLSETNCEPEIISHHSNSATGTIDSHDKHEHCKFLKLVLSKHSHPFLTIANQQQLNTLTFEKVVPTKINNWFSHSDSEYHQARAPPVV